MMKALIAPCSRQTLQLSKQSLAKVWSSRGRSKFSGMKHRSSGPRVGLHTGKLRKRRTEVGNWLRAKL